MIDNIFNILNLKQTSIVLNFLMDEMTILFVSFVVSSLLALLLHKCARLTKVINWLFKLILVVPIFLLIAWIFIKHNIVLTIYLYWIIGSAFATCVLFPVINNAFTKINPELKTTAVALGLSKKKILFKIELPLVIADIIGGLKKIVFYSSIWLMIINLISIRNCNQISLIHFSKIQCNIAIVLTLSVLLLNFIFCLVKLFNAKFQWMFLIIVLLFGIVSLGAYSLNNIKTVANSAKSEQIIIASKDDSQFDIIANMYKILLEKNKKYHVTFSRRKDDRQILKELRNGNIDIYPEETRKVFSLIDNSDKKFANIDELYRYTRDILYKQDLIYMTPMAYHNNYVLIADKEFAKQNKITKISDLQKYKSKLVVGMFKDFAYASNGYEGLKDVYKLDFPKMSVTTADQCYEKLRKRQVNLIAATSNDPEIKKNNLLILNDDKYYFVPYQVAPIITKRFAKKHHQVVKIIEKLAGKITDDEMIQLETQVKLEHKNAAKVAKAFLQRNKLI